MLRFVLSIGIVAAGLLTCPGVAETTAEAAGPEPPAGKLYPHRWVRISRRLQTDDDIAAPAPADIPACC